MRSFLDSPLRACQQLGGADCDGGSDTPLDYRVKAGGTAAGEVTWTPPQDIQDMLPNMPQDARNHLFQLIEGHLGRAAVVAMLVTNNSDVMALTAKDIDDLTQTFMNVDTLTGYQSKLMHTPLLNSSTE